MGDIVRAIRAAVELPLTRADLFKDFGVAAPTGILLHGPPGTGKTLIARSLAEELKVHIVSVGAGELLAEHLGEAEQRLATAFSEARRRVPALLFIDEVDAIGSSRDAAGGGDAAGKECCGPDTGDGGSATHDTDKPGGARPKAWTLRKCSARFVSIELADVAR